MDSTLHSLKTKRLLDFFREELLKRFPNMDHNHLPDSIDSIDEENMMLDVSGLNVSCHYLWEYEGNVELWSEPEKVDTGNRTPPFYEIYYIGVEGIQISDWSCGETCDSPCEFGEYTNEDCDVWQDTNDFDSTDTCDIPIPEEIFNIIQELRIPV